MRSIICTRPGLLEYADAVMPSRQYGQTLLKIKRVGICGTDLHAFDGTQPYFSYPRILGHEMAAVIEETDAPGFTAGMPVTIIPYFQCGICIACKSGKPNCCEHISVCGVHADGAMRDFFVVPDSSLLNANGLNLDELALVEPLAIGAHGVRRAGITPGEHVLIMGAGPIGLAAILFASVAGGNVILCDINDQRLSFAQNMVPGIRVINPVTQDVIAALKATTNGNMPSVVIDATGNLAAINNGFSYMAHTGRYVLIGLQKGDISFSHPEFHKREATLMSSRNATREDFDLVIRAIRNGQVNASALITHRLTFDEVVERFVHLSDPVNNVVKAIIEM